MKELSKSFDAYALRARLLPAIVATAPALAALALLISWKTFDLSNGIATLGILALLFALADLTRERGRVVERMLFAEYKGMPSIILFRRNDPTIDGGTKDRYRAFLAEKLGEKAPPPELESSDPDKADAFYIQCGGWLRENTRDTKKFPILFGENITYGFRRNLLGVKWIALALNVAVVAFCVLLLWYQSWKLDTEQGSRVIVVLVVAVIHAFYMLLVVRRSAVWDAARAYGRQLIFSCEFFLAKKKTMVKKGAPRESKARKKGADGTINSSKARFEDDREG